MIYFPLPVFVLFPPFFWLSCLVNLNNLQPTVNAGFSEQPRPFKRVYRPVCSFWLSFRINFILPVGQHMFHLLFGQLFLAYYVAWTHQTEQLLPADIFDVIASLHYVLLFGWSSVSYDRQCSSNDMILHDIASVCCTVAASSAFDWI